MMPRIAKEKPQLGLAQLSLMMASVARQQSHDLRSLLVQLYVPKTVINLFDCAMFRLVYGSVFELH